MGTARINNTLKQYTEAESREIYDLMISNSRIIQVTAGGVRVFYKTTQFSVKEILRARRVFPQIDRTEKLDFVLVDSFKGWKNYFVNENTDRMVQQMPIWRRYVKNRLSKLAVAFRFNISAKGTSLFAWYSSKAMAGCGVVWNIEGLFEEHAKILSLWFNSTVYALQIYLNRVETEGAWMQIQKYVMDDLLVIHPLRLAKSQKKAILKTFEEVKDIEFPSFLKQLKDKFPARVAIDKTVLKVLGFNDDEIDRILDSLYPALANEIEQLKTLMAG